MKVMHYNRVPVLYMKP